MRLRSYRAFVGILSVLAAVPSLPAPAKTAGHPARHAARTAALPDSPEDDEPSVRSGSPEDEEPEEAPGSAPRLLPGEPPQIQGIAGILVDPRTGTVLWQKNAHLRRPIASLTKVMTTLLILESGKLDDVVTASKTANQTPYSSAYLAVGEKVKLRDLLWAILLRSANDACVAAAEDLGGSVPKFVAQMNRRARELGLKDTHFVTPNGLHDPNHYSSAADLVTITLEDMKYPLFNEMVRTKKHVIERSIRKQNGVMVSRSRILWKWPLADGVKTGYTKQAGHCFIGSATKDGWRLLSVVLHSPHVGDDTRQLLEYGFRDCRSVKLADARQPLAAVRVAAGQERTVPLGLASPVYAVVCRKAAAPTGPTYAGLPKEIRAPVRPGAAFGRVEWRAPGGKTVAASLVALKPVPEMAVVAAARSAAGVWWPFAAVLCALGAIRYGAGSKDHRQRGRRLAKGGRRVDRRR